MYSSCSFFLSSFVVEQPGYRLSADNEAWMSFAGGSFHPVSYTHLDVYKRQLIDYLKLDEVGIERHVGTVLCLRMHVEHPVISVNPLD